MIVELTLSQALYVILHMRESDVQAFRAKYPKMDRQTYAMERFNASDIRYCLTTADGEPVAIGGAQFATPGVATLWLIGTERIVRHRIELSRFGRRIVREIFANDLAHRIQAYTLASLPWCADFARFIGFCEPVAPLRAAGANGEDIEVDAMLKGA